MGDWAVLQNSGKGKSEQLGGRAVGQDGLWSQGQMRGDPSSMGGGGVRRGQPDACTRQHEARVSGLGVGQLTRPCARDQEGLGG